MVKAVVLPPFAAVKITASTPVWVAASAIVFVPLPILTWSVAVVTPPPRLSVIKSLPLPNFTMSFCPESVRVRLTFALSEAPFTVKPAPLSAIVAVTAPARLAVVAELSVSEVRVSVPVPVLLRPRTTADDVAEVAMVKLPPVSLISKFADAVSVKVKATAPVSESSIVNVPA